MAINIIKNNKDTTAVIGDNNIVTVSKKLSEIRETEITSQGQDWGEVVKQIKNIQELVIALADEHEEIRDQQLVPTLSRAKLEAAKLEKEPGKEKKGFLQSFKTFCDLSNKVTDLAVKVSPFIVVIAKLIGVSMP